MIIETLLVAVGAVSALAGAAVLRRWSPTGRFSLPWDLVARMGPSVRPVPGPRGGTAFIEILPYDPPALATVDDGALVVSVRVPITGARLTQLSIDGPQFDAAPVMSEVRLRNDEEFAAAVATLRRSAQSARLDGDTLSVSTTGGHDTLPRDLAPLLAPLFYGARRFAAALEAAVEPLPPIDSNWRAKTSSSASSGTPFVVRG